MTTGWSRGGMARVTVATSSMPGGCVRRCSFCVRRRFHVPIPNDNRDSAVGRMRRILLLKQTAICKAPNLHHLVGTNSVRLHYLAGGIGPIRRQLPVAIALSRKRTRIGMTFDEKSIREL